MRVIYCLAVFAAGLVAVRPVWAQQPTAAGVYSIRGSNDFSYYDDDAQPPVPNDEGNDASASDHVGPNAPAVAGSCGSCCQKSCCKSGRCDFGDPWKAFPMECSNWVFGGWIEGGFIQNGEGSGVTDNFPVEFSDREGFNLNQGWAYAGKELSGDGFDWGFRMDYVYGTDALDTQAFGDGGWDFGWNSSSQYGSAIPQLYVEAGVGDVSVKAGHFFTIIGYEVVQAPQNFFYTHALTMVYGEPFTHTGVLASTPVGEFITVTGGWTSGWDSGWENRNDASTFLGGIGVTLTDNLSVNWAVNGGDFGTGMGDIYMNSFVIQAGLTDRVRYILQHDFANNSDLGRADAEWYGINQYLIMDVNGCLSLGGRFEWFRDDDGARLGTAGHYYECTIGTNVRMHSNFIVRPELRWDWFDGVGTPLAGNSDSLFTGGLDFILTF